MATVMQAELQRGGEKKKPKPDSSEFSELIWNTDAAKFS